MKANPRARIESNPCTCNEPRRWRPKGRPPSRALIVAHGGNVHVLDYIGPDVDWGIEIIGAELFLRGWDEDGVFVWSGHLHVWTDCFGEHDCELVTDEARPPTTEEWRAWCADGERPWSETGDAYYYPEEPCPVHPPKVEPNDAPSTVECGACGATLYAETGGVRDPVAGFCVRCGTASIFEVCDRCDPVARRFRCDTPVCIGRGSDGDGCGTIGGTSGDTCPDCGGMMLDPSSVEDAKKLARSLATLANADAGARTAQQCVGCPKKEG